VQTIYIDELVSLVWNNFTHFAKKSPITISY
jgi:hypothetical protein